MSVGLSDEERSRIARYVSTLEGDVFALAGLPEEVIAVLFAYYSRSKDDLRTNLARLLADQDLGIDGGGASAGGGSLHLASEKARAFHEKWVVGYGHGSVAEHAVVHLAIENVSIVVSKAIEDLRLGSYTEKSTRYVGFDNASFVRLPELPAPLAARYEVTASSLFATYAALVPRVEAEVRRRHPRGEKQAEPAYNAVVRAKTFDLLRGLLPAGTRTNLGLTANARALEILLSKMLSSPLAETRRTATAMHQAAATITPTLVKYVAPNEYRQTLATGITTALLDARAMAPTGTASDIDVLSAPPPVRLLRSDPDALLRVVHALFYETCELDAYDLGDQVAAASDEQLARVLRTSLERRGRFDPAPRALETTKLTFEVTTDFGAYRDLQRHRMLSPFPQRLGMALGFDEPPELEEMGVVDEYRAAMQRAQDTWRAIAATHPYEAQYVVPLASRVRVLWEMNLRELFHVVELRSAKQGHASYRRIAQEIYRTAVDAFPWLEGLVRVDLEEYPLARS